MGIYAVLWRESPTKSLTAAAAVLAGVAIGILSLDFRYNFLNVIAVSNPIELMLAFVAVDTPDLIQPPEPLPSRLLTKLFYGLGRALAVHSFIRAPTHLRMAHPSQGLAT